MSAPRGGPSGRRARPRPDGLGAALALLLLVSAGPGAAGTGPFGLRALQEPRISTEVDVSETTVGGRFHLTVEVEHAPEARAAFPDSLDLTPFEVLDVRIADPVARDGTLHSTARYTLTVFELGELEIPSFEVAVVHPDGTTAALDTSPWGVVVASVGLDEGGDIRDVKGPLDVPLSRLVVSAWILGALLLAALLFWLYRRHRSQSAAGPVPVAVPVRRPWEVAEDALRELEVSDLLDRGRVKDYYIRVSEIIRAYVEAQFGVPALEMASFEVLDGLRALGLDAETIRTFEGFFAECDLVKFAKLRPDRGHAQEIVPRARRLVERTKVGRPAPPEVEAATTEDAAMVGAPPQGDPGRRTPAGPGAASGHADGHPSSAEPGTPEAEP